mmetsp:Transcript_25964/g.54445  ORF Transcript_25964/g.54445 Transcript_25964/m.54445 type:complete len:346 (+) Transcript_25964:284-1321(+)
MSTKLNPLQSTATIAILVASPRSGSSFLTQTLMSHPQVLQFGELFSFNSHVRLPCAQLSSDAVPTTATGSHSSITNCGHSDQVDDMHVNTTGFCMPESLFSARHSTGTASAAFINSLAELAENAGKRVVGFKLMPFQLFQSKGKPQHRFPLGSPGQFSHLLTSLQPRRIALIILERTDKALQYVSGELGARDSRCYHMLDCRNMSIEFDQARFEWFVNLQQTYYGAVEEEIQQAINKSKGLRIQVLHLNYEQDVNVPASNLEHTFLRAFNFLKIEESKQAVAKALTEHNSFDRNTPLESNVLQRRIANWADLPLQIRAKLTNFSIVASAAHSHDEDVTFSRNFTF